MRRLLLTLAATGALAACAGDRPVRVLQDDGTEVLLSVADATAEPAPKAAAVPAPEAEAEREPEPAYDPEPALPDPAQVAALPPPTVDAEAVARAPDPAGLVGKAAVAVQAAFGDATLRRREPPAEVWQYRTGACVLDLVFYPDGPGGAPQVAHVDLRPVDAPAIDGKTCAAHVIAGTPGRD